MSEAQQSPRSTILEEVRVFLDLPLPPLNGSIMHELEQISKLRNKLVHERTIAHIDLFHAQERFRRPQEKGLTDFDRRILLNDMIAEEQSNYEYLCDLIHLLEDRRQDIHFLINAPKNEVTINPTTINDIKPT